MAKPANIPQGGPPGPLGVLEILAVLGFRGICSPELPWACPWRTEDNKEVWLPDHGLQPSGPGILGFMV